MISSAEEFVRLRRSNLPEEYARAGQDEAPMAVWLDAITQFPEMREWIAHNKTVPLEILEILARDESASVRATVAAKRKLSAQLFENLSHDPDEGVRHRVICNTKVPRQVLERLAADPAEFVRAAARSRLERA